MTSAGHPLFAIATPAYILIGRCFEGRDLIARLGDQYRRYRERVGTLLPGFGSRQRQQPTVGKYS